MDAKTKEIWQQIFYPDTTNDSTVSKMDKLQTLTRSLPFSGKQHTSITNAPKAKYRGSGAKPAEATSAIEESPFSGLEHKQQKTSQNQLSKHNGSGAAQLVMFRNSETIPCDTGGTIRQKRPG